MLQRFRESLALLLIILLPFHALLVTVLTKLIAGPGHAPLPQLVLWKEAILGVILMIAVFETLRNGQWTMDNGKLWRIDRIDILILSLIFLAVIVSIFNYQLSHLRPFGGFGGQAIINFVFGFKYDFVPLVAFLILRRVPWSEAFKTNVMRLLLIVGSIVAGYGILTFFLPQSFFTALGYSDLHSLYLPDAPLAAFQQIEALGVRRIQSVMSGPNQLGLWLLIPFSISLMQFFGKDKSHKIINYQLSIINSAVIAIAILLTFSRSAWVAAAVILFVVLWQNVPHKAFKIILCQLFFLAAVFITSVSIIVPQLILRTASTRDHFVRPLEAIHTMIAHPLGLGLGSAGPASNRVSDACVHLPAGSDASWAKDRPSLCVFVADVQTQPSNRACNCPRLPENWYLQIGVELGILGFVLFVILTVLLLRKLQATSYKLKASPMESLLVQTAFLSFLGISLAALFLHAWEDAAVAYTVWIFAAIVLQLKNKPSDTVQ